MAWTTPFTWTFKYIPTFTKLNEQLRDNILVLKTCISDTGKPKNRTVAKSADYTLTYSDDTVRFTGTHNATLPTAVGHDGEQFIVKNAGTGVITVLTTSSQTIDGLSSYVLTAQWFSVTVESDGANWIIV